MDSKHSFPGAPNQLDRQFAVTAAHKAWVTDITYIATDEGWLYLGVKDLFNGELVGCPLDARMTQQLVMQAYFHAVAAMRPDKGLIHHSVVAASIALTPIKAPAPVRHAAFNEPQGQLLGQRTDGKLLRFPED